MAENKEEKVLPKKIDPVFSKDQIMASHWYSHRYDMLSTLLKEGEKYSHADVDKMIKEFMSKGVK